MKKALALALLSASLTGCAALNAADCGTDWYATGQRDGRLGASPQADAYAARCGNVDRARYAEGWDAGWAMRPRVTAF